MTEPPTEVAKWKYKEDLSHAHAVGVLEGILFGLLAAFFGPGVFNIVSRLFHLVPDWLWALAVFLLGAAPLLLHLVRRYQNRD
jgi:hypothetical protein